MGWNSWDCFATTVTEAQTRAQAEYMAGHLKKHGWEYVVVDIQWYEPGATGYDYRKGAPLVMDEWGRLLPAENRFPSAGGGAGFKLLVEHVHSLGLKFGIHLMRGIPRLAVERNLPVKGTDVRAQDIADMKSICPWNPDMYGVDMSKPGAQEYYDSVFALIASWGVDYVKVDDIARPYDAHSAEIEAIRKAIDQAGRPMVLSLSPGETIIAAAEHVKRHANLWRISDDFWDNWPALHEQFARLDRWNPHRISGAWPDADMLPFGVIDLGKRTTRFTKDEQYTVMTLWSIARSPLMHGGDMTKMDEFTLSLLTNDDVLAVNQRSENNRPLFNRDNLIGWMADVPGSPDKYVALFNARERIELAPERAVFRGGVSRDAGRQSVAVDLEVTGATSLVLVADPTVDGTTWDHALWIDPRVVMADGSERSLLDQSWTRADAFWSNLSTEKAPGGGRMSSGGKPVARGIGAHAPALIEYALPAGAVRFLATAALDDAAVKATKGGSVEFRVFVGRPGDGSERPGLPVEVALKDLGISGPVKVRDLWAKQDLGEIGERFAPVIPWHGAGLYRVSVPAP
ncbi:Melibiase subfamily [Nibricoccus aquaticus]|uniref:Melibiase subfamily n=2 Tax=Nibricoccus aquaticus TaxID=2576891 RepID=A0A290QD52_9BACT|nr:Melibiase subfamily [Nibricoccus aquaticus]